MCGRYALAAESTELLEAFDVPPPDFEVVPRYNIAPGQQAPIVAEDRHGRRMGLLTWGLVPGWREEPGRGLINARSESVLEKPSFREAFERRRCLVPASGFYEWKKEAGGKRPFWIYPTGGGVISFAGIWERWSRPGADARHAFAILTTAASGDVAQVHDRMPVTIRAADQDAWLSRWDGLAAAALLGSQPAPAYVCRPVSTRVNRLQEDDPGLLDHVDS